MRLFCFLAVFQRSFSWFFKWSSVELNKKNQKPKKNKNKKLCNATPTFSLFRHVPIGSADAIGRPEKEQLGTLPIPPMRERERETGAFLVDGLAKEAFDGLDSYRVFTASFQVSFIGFTVFNNKKPTTTTTFPLFMFALLVHFTHSSSLFFVVWWVCECVNRAVMRVRRVFIDRHVLIGRPIGRFERKNVEKIKV